MGTNRKEDQRCPALTLRGQRCKRLVPAGQTACWVHSAGAWPEAGDGRRCTAMVGERRCRGWALHGSKPPLCQSHASERLFQGDEEDEARGAIAQALAEISAELNLDPRSPRTT